MADINEDLMFVYICMAGESQQGGPGCTFVDHEKGTAFYVKGVDITPVVFRDEFVRTLEDDEMRNYFMVHKVAGQYHVTSFPRAEALNVDWEPYVRHINAKAS